MKSHSLTGHERLVILRAISQEAQPHFESILLEPTGGAWVVWPIAQIGGTLSFFFDLDGCEVRRPVVGFSDRLSVFDDTLAAPIADRLRAIWPFVFEQLKLAADREEREAAIAEGELDLEWCDLEEAAERDALGELGIRCRKIMLDLVLHPTWDPDEIGMYINSGPGVGMCYVAALELGLVALRDGVDPEDFRFPDLIAPDVVQQIIRAAEKATWPIQLPLSGHDRIRLGAELRRIDRAA